jgi:hypothetical protein
MPKLPHSLQYLEIDNYYRHIIPELSFKIRNITLPDSYKYIDLMIELYGDKIIIKN